ncbi:hypothetical protein Q1695_004633 [Nippostrongylus brasiliensis]|nr:hypothetical protein Q1695_004633 [Nippostrongylus brasiliensis]
MCSEDSAKSDDYFRSEDREVNLVLSTEQISDFELSADRLRHPVGIRSLGTVDAELDPKGRSSPLAPRPMNMSWNSS